MISRREMGSWLSGPTRAPDAQAPGVRLGLPAAGPGSVARLSRRVPALIVDWVCALLISHAFFDGDSLWTLGVFAIVQVLTLGTIGCSPGHRLFGLRLVRTNGGYAGPVPAVVRTLLLCLVIPAVFYDTDLRGMHDRAAGTVLVRV